MPESVEWMEDGWEKRGLSVSGSLTGTCGDLNMVTSRVGGLSIATVERPHESSLAVRYHQGMHGSGLQNIYVHFGEACGVNG